MMKLMNLTFRIVVSEKKFKNFVENFVLLTSCHTIFGQIKHDKFFGGSEKVQFQCRTQTKAPVDVKLNGMQDNHPGIFDIFLFSPRIRFKNSFLRK